MTTTTTPTVEAVALVEPLVVALKELHRLTRGRVLACTANLDIDAGRGVIVDTDHVADATLAALTAAFGDDIIDGDISDSLWQLIAHLTGSMGVDAVLEDHDPQRVIDNAEWEARFLAEHPEFAS